MNISDEFILNCNDEIHYERDWIGSLDIEDDTVDDDLAINVLFLCFFPSKPNLLDLIYHFTKSIFFLKPPFIYVTAFPGLVSHMIIF